MTDEWEDMTVDEVRREAIQRLLEFQDPDRFTRSNCYPEEYVVDWIVRLVEVRAGRLVMQKKPDLTWDEHREKPDEE